MSNTVAVDVTNDIVDNARSQKFQVPDFVEIKNEACQYGDPHRFLVQFLMKHCEITKKTFYIAFIRYFVTTVLNRDYSVISKIQATSSELDLLVNSLIEILNEKISVLGLRVVLMEREENGTEVIILLSERQYSDAMLGASGYTSDEVFLLTCYITEMLKGDGCVSYSWALRAARDLPNPLTQAKAQSFMEKLESEKWIAMIDGDLWLEPRAIAELEPLLRTKYNSPVCPICQKIVIRKSSAVSCENCASYIHLTCCKKLATLTAHDEVECPGLRTLGCKEKFSKIRLENGVLPAQPNVTQKSVRKRTVHMDSNLEGDDMCYEEGRRPGRLRKI